MLKLKSKKLNRSLSGNVVVCGILVLVGAFFAFPLFYALLGSVKPYEEIFLFPPRLFVYNPTLENFRDFFALCAGSYMPFTRYLFNSVFISLVVTVLHVLLSSMAAYPLAKNDFVGKNALFKIVVTALLFTGQVVALPQYILMAEMKIINTYLAVIFPSLGAAMGLFLMKQFMEQIPSAMIEAPRIDGANEAQILFRVVMPNVRPAWLTLSIFTFQTIWNTSGQNVLFDEQLKMLPTMLNQIMNESTIVRMGASMASAIFLMIPPIVFFILSQSKVVKTMAFAGIKE